MTKLEKFNFSKMEGNSLRPGLRMDDSTRKQGCILVKAPLLNCLTPIVAFSRIALPRADSLKPRKTYFKPTNIEIILISVA